jgi:hypothetical protein
MLARDQVKVFKALGGGWQPRAQARQKRRLDAVGLFAFPPAQRRMVIRH